MNEIKIPCADHKKNKLFRQTFQTKTPGKYYLRSIVLFVAAVLLSFSVIPLSFSAQDSSGMVTQISGSVLYISQGETDTAKLGAFMKLYDGDKVVLEPGSRLQLIFFDSGRKETWDGPAQFVIGQSESLAEKEKGAPPKVSSMPDVVTKEVRRIAKIVDPSRMQTAGAKIVRGSPGDDKNEEPLPTVELDESEERELNLARNTYKMLLEDAEKNDITPELFLFSVLADFDQFGEMKELIDQMKKKQPENPTINQLDEWMEDQM